MTCKFFITIVDYIDFDGNPIMKKLYCSDENKHIDKHLIIAKDEDGEYI